MQFPNPRDVFAAQRQARVWEKACRLFQDGYAAYQTGVKGVWGIYSPEGKAYTVDLNTQTCTCPDYEEHGDYCKHVVGLQAQLDAEACEEAQIKAQEEEVALLASAECAAGCDYPEADLSASGCLW